MHNSPTPEAKRTPQQSELSSRSAVIGSAIELLQGAIQQTPSVDIVPAQLTADRPYAAVQPETALQPRGDSTGVVRQMSDHRPEEGGSGVVPPTATDELADVVNLGARRAPLPYSPEDLDVDRIRREVELEAA
jgi:hypothetical protein